MRISLNSCKVSSFFEELQEDKEAAHSYFKAGNMQILARPSAKERKEGLGL